MKRANSLEKSSDAGKDWGQEEKGMTQNEIIGWHHWLNGHEFEQTPGDGEGQGSLACHSPRGHKELDTTYWLQNNRDREGMRESCSISPCRQPLPSPHTLGSLALQQPCIWARVSSENSTITHSLSPPDRIRLKKKKREPERRDKAPLLWIH